MKLVDDGKGMEFETVVGSRRETKYGDGRGTRFLQFNSMFLWRLDDNMTDDMKDEMCQY